MSGRGIADRALLIHCSAGPNAHGRARGQRRGVCRARVGHTVPDGKPRRRHDAGGDGGMDDPSNADATYARRNAVRHRLVPLLEELCGGEDALLARLEETTEQSIMLRAQLDETLAPSGGCGSRPQQPEQPGQQVASFDVREWKLLPGDLARLDALHSYVAQATAPAVPSYAQVRALMLMLDGERPDDAGRGALRGGRGVLTSVGGSAGARRPGGRWERALSGGQVARCAHGVLTVGPRTEALAGASAHCATPATAEGER